MESSIERISEVECRVKVEIPWEEVSSRLSSKMSELRRRARLPGFRPGKVPPAVLERMFGKGVREELAHEIVQETFQDAVTRHDTTPLTQPVLESSQLDKGAPFTYEARFEVPPRIEPNDYTGVPVRRRPAKADPKLVDEEIGRKREELAELRELPEGTTREITQPLDVWTVDVDAQIGAQRINRKDVQVEIGSTKNEVVPGLSAAMFDTRLDQVGQIRTLRFTPPAERMREELRGREAVVQLGLREVRVKVLPELDDEFARDTGDAESLQELRDKIEAKLREADGEEAEREARRRLVVELLERNAFEPAPSMVAREVAAQVEQTKRQLANQGLRLSALGMTENQLAQRFRPQALFNVKAYLLLDSIGKTEAIEVSDEDFEAELAKEAEESGQNLARMRASMEKNGQLILMRAQMREERILDFLMGKAEITEAEDPPEDHDHDHHDHDHDHHHHDHDHDHGHDHDHHDHAHASEVEATADGGAATAEGGEAAAEGSAEGEAKGSE
ncbi:trigger factor [Paraliomyxa miuraensis]|uniref:trigger factor n=1 Tax=Paraliomyxa miuraensis TaxID=376150 RepID=UPI0022543C5C|nr:trigger factor [Paraliomyxa miuraensis]MCX4240291.1 trigger factor [Paraliomyxa miuraensis]